MGWFAVGGAAAMLAVIMGMLVNGLTAFFVPMEHAEGWARADIASINSFGLIGLAVMGQNLVLNMTDHGYKVAVYNRTTSKVDEFLAHEAKGTQVEGAHSVAELCAMLKRPRRVMIMVKAGDVVDQTIQQLLPTLSLHDALPI